MSKNEPGPDKWKEQATYWKSVPAEVIDKLRKTSVTWGKQADDQTVLLVRRD
jgi:hypothetical protein